jgi:hypothetical protein
MAATSEKMPAYPFTEDDARRAHDDWGANCGPIALAACLGITLDDLRPKLQVCQFEAKRYMTPTMMAAALRECGVRVATGLPRDVLPFSGLVRIQWHGPWTAPGANPKWAYRQTHWISSLRYDAEWWVFDCNGGWRTFDSWKSEIVPLLTQSIPRADGKWSVTHHWEIRSAG